MDPVILLCQIEDSFNISNEYPSGSRPGLVPQIFKINTPKTSTPIPAIIIESKKLISNFLPNISFIDIDEYVQLNDLRKTFSGIDPSILELVRTKVNPFSIKYDIGTSIFRYNDAIKLANIDSLFNITQRKGGILGSQEYGPPTTNIPLDREEESVSNIDRRDGFNYCGLSLDSEGFSEYLSFRFQSYCGYEMSPITNYSQDQNQTHDTVQILHGHDGTGNPITNREWFSQQVLSKTGDGVYLVIADSSIKIAKRISSYHEYDAAQIILSETIIAMRILNRRGVFVCRIFDTTSIFMGELLFIIATIFEEFNIIKPITTSPETSEKYLVCKYPRANLVEGYTQLLEQVALSYSTDTIITGFLPDGTLSDSFIEYIRNINTSLLKQEMYYLSKIREYLDISSGKIPVMELNITIPRYNLYKALIYWNIPDNETPLPKKSQIDEHIVSFPVASPPIISQEMIDSDERVTLLGPLSPNSSSSKQRPSSPPPIRSPIQSPQRDIYSQPLYLEYTSGNQMVSPISITDLQNTKNDLLDTTFGIDTISPNLLYPKTYIIRTSHYNQLDVEQMFNESGWRQAKSGETPTFVYEDGRFITRGQSYNGPTIVKTTMGESRKLISDKSQLYHQLKGAHQPIQYNIPSNSDKHYIENITQITFGKDPNSIWILRPVGPIYFKGKDIVIIKNPEDLYQSINPNVKYVLSQYIDNPLLWEEKYKFHFRVYVLYGTDGNYILDPRLIFIYPAELPYVQGNYGDTRIHDTHYIKGRVENLEHFKDMYPHQYDSIMNQINAIVDDTFKSFEPDVYPETKFAVNLFGFDIMVDDNFNVLLLEVNDKVGLMEVPMEIIIGNTIKSVERLLRQKYTYIIRSDDEWYGNDLVEHVFRENGWIPFNQINGDEPDMVYEDGKYITNRLTYKGHTKVKTVMGPSLSNITDKGKLFHTMKGKHMVSQFNIPANPSNQQLERIINLNLTDADIWIVRPVSKEGYKGWGIFIFDRSVDSIYDFQKQLQSNTPYVISRYITDPLLWEDKYKFHIRVPVIMASDGKYITDPHMFFIYPAELPYINQDYSNKDIHDSHRISEERTGNMKQLMEQYNQIYPSIINQISEILSQVLTSFNPNVYPESDHALQVLGFDFMIDTSGIVYLIEINSRVGVSSHINLFINYIIKTAERLLKSTKSTNTYLVQSDWYKPEDISPVFTEKGWIPFTQIKSDAIPTLVYLDGKFMYGRHLYKGGSVVKSTLNDNKLKITEKNDLFDTLATHYPNNQIMIPQYRYNKGTSLQPYADIFNTYPVWIIKPVGKGYKSGKGIFRVTNNKELMRLVKSNTDYVFAVYLDNPLLFQGKKFHIRSLVIVGSDSQYIHLKELEEVYRATKDYQQGNYNNNDIHDTHFVSHEYTLNKNDLIKEYGEKRVDSMYDSIDNIISTVVTSFTPEPFEESSHAFEVFGFDFIIEDNDHVYLIEVNRWVGLEGYDPNILFGAIIDTTERLIG